MEQTEMSSWIDRELNELSELKTYEKIEGFKMEENKTYEFDVDFSNEFERWQDPVNNLVKKIIPVVLKCADGTTKKYNFWLNVKNPTYSEILRLGQAGQTHFKMMKTGQKKATRYIFVK